MPTPYGLVIFDVDGTLVDSQAVIVASMRAAFAAVGLAAPERETLLSVVGLSLPIALATLTPTEPPERQARLVEAYRDAHSSLRSTADGASPLFPGAREALERLDGRGALLAVATGKGRDGLEKLLDQHDLRGFFVGTQTADDAPSKPHPGMIENLLAATGAKPSLSAMIGDTSFDMEMGRAAGASAIGVSWGYHPVDLLVQAGAHGVIDRFDALDGALDAVGRAAA